MLHEDFTYDSFNRLTSVETNGVTYSMVYDNYGRMSSKQQRGFSFTNARYSSTHPHAIARVQTNPVPPINDHTITYTPFDKVETVRAGRDEILFEYGYDRQRIRMTETFGGHERVKTYIGNCEFVDNDFGPRYSFTHLCSPDGIFAVAECTREGCKMHYVHTDNLGSWDIITDMGGDLEQSLSFDAWGNRRNAGTWSGTATDIPLFDRGFTGHEHLYNFGLINMNGRVYDPFMSTFLSPDNYIQAPDNSQNFNRYAYCLNNPLKYTDPSGEFWHIVIGAAIGGMVNLTTNWGKIDTFGEGLAYFGIGAAAGALSAGVGAGVSSLIGGGAFGAGFLGTTAAKTAVTSFASGSVIGASSGLAGGFVTGAGNSWMQGANFCQGLLAGAKAGGQGAVMGGLIGGISGGIDAARDGRNFWSGDIIMKAKRAYPTGPDYQQQLGSNDCVPTNGKVINNYHKGNMSVKDIRDTYWISNTTDPVNSEQFYAEMARGEHAVYNIAYNGEFNEKCVFNDFYYNNADIAIDVSTGKEVAHNVLLREAQCRIHQTWGRGAHNIVSYKFWIQDPEIGYLISKPFDFNKAIQVHFLYY